MFGHAQHHERRKLQEISLSEACELVRSRACRSQAGHAALAGDYEEAVEEADEWEEGRFEGEVPVV